MVAVSTPLAYAFSKPPSGRLLVNTPVLCGYWPRRIVVRDGQHSDSGTYMLENETPCAASSFLTFGM